MGKKCLTNIILLAFTLLLSIIVSEKALYIAPHLVISSSLIVYSFSYLLTAKLNEEVNINDIKDVLKKVIIDVFVFYVIMIVINTLSGLTSVREVTNALRIVFTPNKFAVLGVNIYYPNIINLISSLLIFYLTHNIFTITFEITSDYASKSISFIISILISFIIDQMIYISVTSFISLYNGSLLLTNYIENLTAAFIVVILSSIIMTIIYSIIQKRNKN